jgi:hypothetical protein
MPTIMGFLAAGLGLALLSDIGRFTTRYAERINRTNLIPFAPRVGVDDAEPPGRAQLVLALRALGIGLLGFGMLIGSPTLRSFPYGTVVAITICAVGLVLWGVLLFPYLWSRAANQRARTVVGLWSVAIVALLAAAVVTARY